MTYFQEQFRALSAPETHPDRDAYTDLHLDRASLPSESSLSAAQLRGLFLAISLTAWAFSNTSVPGAAASAASQLSSITAHTVSHLMVSGLADLEVPSRPGGSERRREEELPEEEIDEALLAAQMHLAAGELVSALQEMHKAVELIADLIEQSPDDLWETLVAAAEDILSAVYEQASSAPQAFDARILELALQLAEITGAERHKEQLAAMKFDEAVAYAV